MQPRRWRLDIALGVILLMDGLRVFMPSLITLFGQAGGTPAEYMGLFALGWFAAPLIVVPLGRVIASKRLVAILGVALVIARLALQATNGGQPQLYASAATVAIGLAWLVAIAMDDTCTRSAFIGVTTGVAGATLIHAAFNTVDLVWRDDMAGWIGTIAVCFGALWLSRRYVGSPDPLSPQTRSAAWWAVGPALLLWGMLAANLGVASTAAENAPASTLKIGIITAMLLTGAASLWMIIWRHATSKAWPRLGTGPYAAGAMTAIALVVIGVTPLPSSAVVVFALIASIAAVSDPRRFAGHPLIPGGVLVGAATVFTTATATANGVTGVHPWWIIAVIPVSAWAIAACLGFAAAAPSDRRPIRAGLALSIGMIGFVVLLFAYYAAYDLPMPNQWVPAVAALVVAAVAWAGRGAAHRGKLTVAARYGMWPVMGATIAIATSVVTAPASVDFHEYVGADLRVVAYNVRMGFDLDGMLAFDEQASVVAELKPDVVVLSEVDRGWFLNGGHDGLSAFADRLGMQAIWAPAADGVWGDAILTHLPVTSVENMPLTPGGPTGAQALRARVTWDGNDVTVIATHLQPPTDWNDSTQVEEVAALAAESAADGSVIVAGDLNLSPSDPVWTILMDAGLVDAFAEHRPFETTWTPGQEIDHILTTPDLAATDPANPDVPHSDHRPIAVTLTRT